MKIQLKESELRGYIRNLIREEIESNDINGSYNVRYIDPEEGRYKMGF